MSSELIKELSNELKARVRQATVIVTQRGESIDARGVLVVGGFVLTAAHCIPWRPWDGNGDVVPPPDFSVRRIDSPNHELEGRLCALEYLADVAVVKLRDKSEAPYVAVVKLRDKSADAFALTISDEDFVTAEPCPVHILTHEDIWLVGTGERRDAFDLELNMSGPIPNATSGSAVVNDLGAIVGILASAGGYEHETQSDYNTGHCGRPCQALPAWIWREIRPKKWDIAEIAPNRSEKGS